MKNFQKILHNILSETSKIFWILFKVILPVVVIIRFLELMGAIPYLAKFLELSASRSIDCRMLCAISGLNTFNSKCP